MGKDQRHNISRIRVENLPHTCNEYAKQGPFGKIRVEYLGEAEGIRFNIGPIRFVIQLSMVTSTAPMSPD